MTIRVLICDDSAVMRGLLTQIIDSDPRLEVVGVAADPLVARDLIKSLDPDVLTLDVEMPRMGGIEFLERLMRLRPMPVVMISSFTERGSEATLRALELGAVDFLAKPGSSLQIGEQAREIREKIIAAFHARKRLAMHMPARPEASAGGVRGSALPERVLREKVVLIGASTGGTEAIKEVLSRLPEACPPLMLVQHMPEMFTASFARRMDSLCALRVKEAEHGERLMAGTAYIAPGHSHLKLGRLGTVMQCELSATPPVKPASSFGRCAVRVGGALAWRECAGGVADGYGKGWRARPVEFAQARCVDAGTGSGEFGSVGHAARSGGHRGRVRDCIAGRYFCSHHGSPGQDDVAVGVNGWLTRSGQAK